MYMYVCMHILYVACMLHVYSVYMYMHVCTCYMLLVDVLWFCIDSGTNHVPDSKLELKIIGNFAIFLKPDEDSLDGHFAAEKNPSRTAESVT